LKTDRSSFSGKRGEEKIMPQQYGGDRGEKRDPKRNQNFSRTRRTSVDVMESN
jgi:hypothetical protein